MSAAMRLTVAVVLLVLTFAGPAPAGWRPPVAGPVMRGFTVGANPFAGGQHRGVDLLAAPGAPVRAPCGGEVVVAGRVGSSGRVVTLLCGRWRVSQLSLGTVAVRRGAVVRAGTRIGTVAPSHEHAGLHFGVRRDGSRFGYVDPLGFLGASRPTPPVAIGRRGPPSRRRSRPFRPSPRRLAPGPAPAPSAAVAPWPAWAGLALVLGGVGVRWRGVGWLRRVRARTSTAAG
jgi:murein DD-endopeptidase MepM/ murein hydrolase activator NlpD